MGATTLGEEHIPDWSVGGKRVGWVGLDRCFVGSKRVGSCERESGRGREFVDGEE